MGVYVIGLTKDWVEVRQAQATPKAVRSQATRTIRVPAGWPASPYGKVEERQFKLSAVYFEGGKTLGTLSRRSYLSLAKKYEQEPVKTGEVSALAGPMLEVVQTPTWRKAHYIV